MSCQVCSPDWFCLTRVEEPPVARHGRRASDVVCIVMSADPATLPPLPVPNLGYCCLNVTLRNQKPQVRCPSKLRPHETVCRYGGNAASGCLRRGRPWFGSTESHAASSEPVFCILRLSRLQVFCNRDCILKTFTERGLDYIGQMALQNCRDLEPILWWNYEHGVRLFRLAPLTFASAVAPELCA